MTLLTTYQQNRYALNELMDYVGTDKFMHLPEKERAVVLEKLGKLVRLAVECGNEEM